MPLVKVNVEIRHSKRLIIIIKKQLQKYVAVLTLSL